MDETTTLEGSVQQNLSMLNKVLKSGITGFTPFKVAMGVEFVPMPELPREPSSSVLLAEWMDIQKPLIKARESQQKQADRKRNLVLGIRYTDLPNT